MVRPYTPCWIVTSSSASASEVQPASAASSKEARDGTNDLDMFWDLSNQYARASACHVVEALASGAPIPDVNVAGAPGRQIFVGAAAADASAAPASRNLHVADRMRVERDLPAEA